MSKFTRRREIGKFRKIRIVREEEGRTDWITETVHHRNRKYGQCALLTVRCTPTVQML